MMGSFDVVTLCTCSALAQQRSEVTRQVKALQAPAHLRGPEVTNNTKSASQQRKAVESASRALASTWFEAEEFVTAEHEPQTLDTVLCLSVTKWVHLNQVDLQGCFLCRFARVTLPIMPACCASCDWRLSLWCREMMA